MIAEHNKLLLQPKITTYGCNGRVKNTDPLQNNWDLLHARLNSHYETKSYKKKRYKNMKAYSKSV